MKHERKVPIIHKVSLPPTKGQKWGARRNFDWKERVRERSGTLEDD